MHRAAELQPHPAAGELLDDVPSVRQRPGEPVQLGDDQGVAGTAGRQRLGQTGTDAVGAGEAVVDVDPCGVDAEGGQAGALGGEVLPTVDTRA